MKYMMFTVLLVWLLAVPTQARQPDDYWNSPRSTYEKRRALFLDYYSENGSGHPLYGVFRQAARAASGRPLEMDKMREVISMTLHLIVCFAWFIWTRSNLSFQQK